MVLTVYGGNAAKMHGFALMFTPDVFLDNSDVDYVISVVWLATLSRCLYY